jgi:hypothetical protein
MSRGLMSVIVVVGFVCLGLASISYAALPRVVGNWEDSNDGWELNAEAAEGTTMQPNKGNATLGNYSLKVFVPSGWQKTVTLDMTGNSDALWDLGIAARIQVDVTLIAKEWVIGTGWVKVIENIVIQDDKEGWQQLDPVEAFGWDGTSDKTFTVTFAVPAQTPPALTHGTLIIITNYGDVTTAGSFYFDNVRLLGPEEPNEPAKSAEPNKPSEPNKP